MMKKIVRAVVRNMAAWPVIGRFFRIVVALLRLPNFRDASLAAQERQLFLEDHRLPAIDEALSMLKAAQNHTEALLVEVEQRSELLEKRTEFFEQYVNTQTALKAAQNHTEALLIEVEQRTELLEKRTEFFEQYVNTQTALKAAQSHTEALLIEVEQRTELLGQRTELLGQRTELLEQYVETQTAANSELDRRYSFFEEEQLPSLLENISNINRDQIASDADRDNIVRSVPVALRAMKRELIEAKQYASALHAEAMNNLNNINDQHIRNLETEKLEKDERLDIMQASADYMSGRIEFVRRELMYEMRYGSSPSEEGGALEKVKSKIVSVNSYKAAKEDGGFRLNLGCGHIPREGYLNVDRRELPGVDIIAEVDDLPIEKKEAKEIFSSHVLEHFPQEQLRRELLPYWVELLKDGGEFRAIVPDAEAMILEYSKGDYSWKDMREVMYGGQDYSGDFHFNMFTPEALVDLLIEAQLSNVEIVEKGRKNGTCYEFEIRGEKII